jgi:hypothetical protein
MRHKCSLLLIALLLLATLATSAIGGQYTDPSGFSFTYPDDWVVVTRQVRDSKDLAPEISKWLAKNNLDLNRVSVVLVRKGPEEFLENLNVVIDNQQMPMTEDSVTQVTRMLPQQYQSLGAKLSKLQGGLQKIASRDAIVINYEAQLPGLSFPLRQRQVFLAGGGNTYIVTCTARPETFDKYSPAFDQIVASMNVPAPISQGFDWTRVLIFAAIGAVVGLCVKLIRDLSAKFGKRAGHIDQA